MNKKYELTTETKMINGHKVYRIKALKSFDTFIGRRVTKGDLGGWVESEMNLSQDGNCWLFDDAAGYENSRRTENSVGHENSRQYGYSRQSGNSQQYGYSMQFGKSMQSGNSWQYGNSMQSGNSQQYGYSRQYGDSMQYGDSQQYGYSRQYGDSMQSGNSMQYGDSRHRTGDDDGAGKLLCIWPCGDMMWTVTVQPDNTIVAGCFHGDFDEFKMAVAEKYGEDYGSYSVCIAILQTAINTKAHFSKVSDSER